MAMTAPASSSDAEGGNFLAPRRDSQPTDHCFRCGKPTPAGVGLCDEHNPQHLSGPSSTQMHATIFGGIVLGVVGFFLLARLAVGTAGPFSAEVTAATADGAGGVALTISLTNDGDATGVADCRFTRDGVPRPDDLAFRAPALAAGQTITIERALRLAPDSPVAYVAEAVSVICD